MSPSSTLRRALAAPALTLAILAPPAHAQVRVQRGSDASKSNVAVSLTAGGSKLEAAGAGQCQHAPQAYIYGKPAKMWTAQFTPSDRSGSVALTLWALAAGGPAQFNLSVSSGAAAQSISTVKGGTVSGSGAVTLQTKGESGEFTIDGTTARGVAVRGTIRCDRFTPLIAEGG